VTAPRQRPPASHPGPSTPRRIPRRGHQLEHLLSRAGYGITPAALAEIDALGAVGWLSRQLNPATIADQQCEDYLGRLDLLPLSAEQVRGRLGDRPRPEVMAQLGEATIARACWSRRQLYEVMVAFWSDRLHVTCPADAVWDWRHRYDADVIRRHALGRFDDLLVEATLHPAALRWFGSDGAGPDAPPEHHARVLLEHHTVGVAAGFTDADVGNCALLLTGFGVDRTGTVFRPVSRHIGSVTVLGDYVDNHDPSVGGPVTEAFLRRLAASEATARSIAYALAVRFVSDTPPPTLVQQLAETYLARQTAITPVLLRLFTSWEFAAAIGGKVRRPYEDLVASVRTLGLTPRGTGRAGLTDLYALAAAAGQAPLSWPGPEGSPDTAASWRFATDTLHRWNAHTTLVSAASVGSPRLDGAVTPARLLGALPTTHGELVTATARRLLATTLSAGQHAAVLAFLKVASATPVRVTSPAVTWRFGELVGLLLHSPQHGVR
jgi:uncharacterized protein (DUF1800 family)